MIYAIIRNDKLTRVKAQGSYIHNDRRSKGHSNKDIDPTRTHLNFYCKKNELTYIKEFDKMKIENNKRTVKDYELFGIAYVLGIDVNDLLKDLSNKF